MTDSPFPEFCRHEQRESLGRPKLNKDGSRILGYTCTRCGWRLYITDKHGRRYAGVWHDPAQRRSPKPRPKTR